MKIADLKHRVAATNPFIIDTVMAVGLAILVCLQIWIITNPPHPSFPVPPNAQDFALLVQREHQQPGAAPYVLAALAFLPLAFRRTSPWSAAGLTGGAALVYSLAHNPPAFVTLGPMIAIYTAAAQARTRRVGILAVLVVGLVAAVVMFALSSSVRWVADSVGAFVLLAAAALLGEAARNRREYIEQVEQRALEAERTREEEALRRVDEERIRIAREVHDIVAHSLSIVTVQAGAAAALLPDQPERARESIENVRATGKQALSELRSMLEVLRTGEGDAPLEPSADLTHVARLIEPLRDTGLHVDLDVTGHLASVPAFASVSAYRIVQEALTNIVRHAEATSARVGIVVADTELSLEVSDDGTGADVDSPKNGGHGIRGMRERVEALGGAFEAGAAAGGRGFRISARIPLMRSAS